MFGMDIDTARDRTFAAIDAMSNALALADGVDVKYLDRLVEDRDRMIFGLHYQLGVPVLEIAARIRMPWMAVYDVVDAAVAKHKEKAKSSSFTLSGTDIPPLP